MAKKQNGRTAAENLRWREGKLAPTMWDLSARLGSEEACEQALIDLKHPGGFACGRCGRAEYARVGGRREFRCKGCDQHLSATSGTILANAKVPLTSWSGAIRVVATGPNEASAQAVARECGVSDVSGLAMLRRTGTAEGLAMAPREVGGRYAGADGAHVACGNDGPGAKGPGSGKTDAPVLVAVPSGACAMRAASDGNGTTTGEFAPAHVPGSHGAGCAGHGANERLPGGRDAGMRKSAHDGDPGESLPTARDVTSNSESWLVGTFHGVSVGRPREYADCLSFAYSHRRGDPFSNILFELAGWPHQRLSEIRGCRVATDPNDPPSEPGKTHSKALRDRWRRQQRKPGEQAKRDEEEKEAEQGEEPKSPETKQGQARNTPPTPAGALLADDIPDGMAAMPGGAFERSAPTARPRPERPVHIPAPRTRGEIAWEFEFFGSLCSS